jgi:hypothetical protein
MQIRAYAIREKGGTAEPFLYERTLGGRDLLVRITHPSLARGDIGVTRKRSRVRVAPAHSGVAQV